VTVAAGVVPDPEGAEPSLRDVLAAALDANREMARLAAVLREENARLRAENAEQAAELERVRADLALTGPPTGGTGCWPTSQPLTPLGHGAGSCATCSAWAWSS
jgi:hypothetical protein